MSEAAQTWFSFLILMAFILECLEPLMTYPKSSYFVIWSAVMPTCKQKFAWKKKAPVVPQFSRLSEGLLVGS